MNGCEVIYEIFHISLHKFNIIDKYVSLFLQRQFYVIN